MAGRFDSGAALAVSLVLLALFLDTGRAESSSPAVLPVAADSPSSQADSPSSQGRATAGATLNLRTEVTTCTSRIFALALRPCCRTWPSLTASFSVAGQP
jgi:hypothetical protein